MSRIGKRPVALPKGVTAQVDGKTVKVKGPKGELQVTLVDDVVALPIELGFSDSCLTARPVERDPLALPLASAQGFRSQPTPSRGALLRMFLARVRLFVHRLVSDPARRLDQPRWGTFRARLLHWNLRYRGALSDCK